MGEFCAVIDELNQMLNAAAPVWMKAGSCAVMVLGIVAFTICLPLLVGGLECESVGDRESHCEMSGPGLVAFMIVVASCFICMCGAVAGILGLVCQLRQNISKVRQRLSELNARYADKGVEFDPREETHMDGTGSFVSTYTLVVQSLSQPVQQAVQATVIGASKPI